LADPGGGELLERRRVLGRDPWRPDAPHVRHVHAPPSVSCPPAGPGPGDEVPGHAPGAAMYRARTREKCPLPQSNGWVAVQLMLVPWLMNRDRLVGPTMTTPPCRFDGAACAYADPTSRSVNCGSGGTGSCISIVPVTSPPAPRVNWAATSTSRPIRHQTPVVPPRVPSVTFDHVGTNGVGSGTSAASFPAGSVSPARNSGSGMRLLPRA